jgi:uncharacterized protein (DUF433 family)
VTSEAIGWRELVVADATILHGQARIRGTRIPVSAVLSALADGLDEERIMAEYPTLTQAAIRAAAAYGAALAAEQIEPLPISEG